MCEVYTSIFIYVHERPTQHRFGSKLKPQICQLCVHEAFDGSCEKRKRAAEEREKEKENKSLFEMRLLRLLRMVL